MLKEILNTKINHEYCTENKHHNKIRCPATKGTLFEHQTVPIRENNVEKECESDRTKVTKG